MEYAIDNVRLKELIFVVRSNRPYFDEFTVALGNLGYQSLHQLINEPDNGAGENALAALLVRASSTQLYDGLGRPYSNSTAHWYFLAWSLRDAPVQRLGPMVPSMPGSTTIARRAALLNRLRVSIRELFPDPESWAWPAIAEVLLDRLEGSRRALKGTLFEAVVRRVLTEYIEVNGLPLSVTGNEVRLFDETYDIEVRGSSGSLLIPVKTRETMGGGHALLFTRDIHKSITVAAAEGHACVPVVIAESWGGNLAGLGTALIIHVPLNPNRVIEIEPILRLEIERLRPLLDALAQP